MPPSVQNASATAVLPGMLARRFVRVRDWPAEANEYADGRAQVVSLTGSSRKSWRLETRLAGAELAALRTFFLANPHKAFLFYDREERREEGATPLYDDTGAAAGPGKYFVRFGGDAFRATVDAARGEAAVELVEVA